MNFELYYFVPWPKCQKVQDTAPREMFSYTDSDTEAGIFVNKQWLDDNISDYGF